MGHSGHSMWIVFWQTLASAGEDRVAALLKATDAIAAPEVIVSLARKLIRQQPRNEWAYYELGMALDRALQDAPPGKLRKLTQQRNTAFSIVLYLDPNGQNAGLVRMALGSAPTPALQIDSVPCSLEAHASFDIAEQLWGSGKKVESRPHYDAALAACPNEPTWWVHSGDAYFPEDIPEALRRYEQGVAIFPCHWMGHRFRADALEYLGRTDDAVAAQARAVTCNPTYEPAWAGLRILAGDQHSRLPLPLTPPKTPQEAATRGPAWKAWYAARLLTDERHLAAALVAVEAGLAAAEPENEWVHFAAAKAQSKLAEAVLLMLFELEMTDDLAALHEQNPDGLWQYVISSFATPSTQAPTP